MKKKGVVPGQVRDKEDKPWTDEEVEELTKMATSTAGMCPVWGT
jgi:hypothetical protein